MKTLCFLGIFLWSLNGFGQGVVSSDPIVPTSTKMSKARFDVLLDQVQNFYGPIFERLGTRLSIERRWRDNAISAAATIRPEGRVLIMFGLSLIHI